MKESAWIQWEDERKGRWENQVDFQAVNESLFPEHDEKNL